MKRVTVNKWIVIAAAVIVLAMGVNLLRVTMADAARGARFQGWVLCTPRGSVNVRSRPDVSGAKTGRMYLGDEVEIDSTSKKGTWAHCVGLPTDLGEGWISGSYITTEPVELTHYTAQVDAKGRVAVWSGMNCRSRAGWLQPGDRVEVWAVSGEWAVTEKGFVRLAYLVG